MMNPFFRHSTVSLPQIGLCFLDQPGMFPSEDLRQILRTEEARATFFCCGCNLRAQPESAALLLRDGHEIGNHTYSGRPLSELEDLDGIWEEVLRCQQTAWEITGREPRLFHAPFPTSDERLTDVLHELSLRRVESDLADRSWSRQESIASIRNRLLRHIRPGDVLSLGLSNPGHTGLLQELLRGLRFLGLQVVPVSKLLEHVPAHPENAPLLELAEQEYRIA